METKLCIDCKHYGHAIEDNATSWAHGKPICRHPMFSFRSDPWFPDYRRKKGQDCGPLGKLFEQSDDVNEES